MRVTAVERDAGPGVVGQLLGTQQVAAAHLCRVEAKPAGTGVDGPFQRCVHFRLARAPIGPDRRCVRDRSAVAVAQPRHSVHAGALAIAGRRQHRCHVGIGTGVAPHDHVDANDAAVGVETHADAVPLPAPVGHRDELLLAALHPAHRAFQKLGRPCHHEELRHRVAATAEAAADVRFSHPHRADWDPEQAAVQVRRTVYALTGAPDVDLAVGRCPRGQRRAADQLERSCDDGARLDRQRRDAVVLAHQIHNARSARTGVVAAGPSRWHRWPAVLATALTRQGCPGIRQPAVSAVTIGSLGGDDRAGRCQESAAVGRVQRAHHVGACFGIQQHVVGGGLLGVDDGWQLVDLDGNQFGGIERCGRGFSQHHCDRFADEADPSSRQQRPSHVAAERGCPVVLQRCQIEQLCIEHGSRARGALGFAEIDAAQFAVSDCRAHEGSMQAAVRNWQIGGESGRSAQHRLILGSESRRRHAVTVVTLIQAFEPARGPQSVAAGRVPPS